MALVYVITHTADHECCVVWTSATLSIYSEVLAHMYRVVTHVCIRALIPHNTDEETGGVQGNIYYVCLKVAIKQTHNYYHELAVSKMYLRSHQEFELMCHFLL